MLISDAHLPIALPKSEISLSSAEILDSMEDIELLMRSTWPLMLEISALTKPNESMVFFL
jgi:hypothetical protein